MISSNVDHSKQSPIVLSLCPGVLGLERGIERAIRRKIRVAAYVEIEAFICANLVAAMETGVLAPAVIHTDVKALRGEIFRGRIDGIIGGYPCQPFSTAGKREGANDPRHLWPFIANIIRDSEPAWCFFENVAGHLTLGFDVVSRELQEMGYRVEAGIFSAEEVGAPHQRKRLFILAIKLGNSSDQRFSQPGFAGEWKLSTQEAERLYDRLELTSNELADSVCIDRRLSESTERDQSNETTGSCKAMADTNDTGLQKQRGRESCSEKDEPLKGCDTGGIFTKRGVEKWPAGPGPYQHEWEEPRTIKRGVGCTVNGYKFREDLLRALGNAVVEQTAELAFITLLQKHYETHKNISPAEENK